MTLKLNASTLKGTIPIEHPKITVKVEPRSDNRFKLEHATSLANSSGQKRNFDELDGDESDDGSRFSQGCAARDGPDDSSDTNDDEVQPDPYDSDVANQSTEVRNEQFVELSQEEIDEAKKEKTRQERIKLRRYGDRLLLACQCIIKYEDGTKELKGIFALGGGNQKSCMWYKNKEKHLHTLKYFTTNKHLFVCSTEQSQGI